MRSDLDVLTTQRDAQLTVPSRHSGHTDFTVYTDVAHSGTDVRTTTITPYITRLDAVRNQKCAPTASRQTHLPTHHAYCASRSEIVEWHTWRWGRLRDAVRLHCRL